MPKELKSELSIVKMRLSRKTLSLDNAYQLLALASTEIPDEVRAKYLRDNGTSIVSADVHIDATGDASLQLQAVVRVVLTYKGDMVRSSERTRAIIGQRIHKLAQKYCSEMTYKEITKTPVK